MVKLKDILEPDLTLSRPVKLHPPPEPKLPLEIGDMDLWFQELALSSEFKRFIYKVWTGRVHRKTSADLNEKLESEIRIRFTNVLNELKTNHKFLKRKELSS